VGGGKGSWAGLGVKKWKSSRFLYVFVYPKSKQMKPNDAKAPISEIWDFNADHALLPTTLNSPPRPQNMALPHHVSTITSLRINPPALLSSRPTPL